MFGPSCRIPPGDIVMRNFWIYVVKNPGKSKSRNTCDVSPLTGKVFQYAKNTVCDSQHGFNIFLSLSTSLGYIIMAADAITAYSQAPPPDDTFYVHMHD